MTNAVCPYIAWPTFRAFANVASICGLVGFPADGLTMLQIRGGWFIDALAKETNIWAIQ